MRGGGIAQLGERLNGIQGVGGSAPPGSTNKTRAIRRMKVIFGEAAEDDLDRIFAWLAEAGGGVGTHAFGGKSNLSPTLTFAASRPKVAINNTNRSLRTSRSIRNSLNSGLLKSRGLS